MLRSAGFLLSQLSAFTCRDGVGQAASGESAQEEQRGPKPKQSRQGCGVSVGRECSLLSFTQGDGAGDQTNRVYLPLTGLACERWPGPEDGWQSLCFKEPLPLSLWHNETIGMFFWQHFHTQSHSSVNSH